MVDSLIIMFPLVAFAFTPTLIATGMSTPLGVKIRSGAGAEAATRWMTLKWRLILISISIITLLIFNILYWDEMNLFGYPFWERFQDIAARTGADDMWGPVFLFIITPLVTLFLLVKSLIEVLCSRDKISKQSFIYRHASGENGAVQFFGVCYYFLAMMIIASGNSTGTLEGTDFIILTDFQIIGGFFWIFRKTKFDHKSDFLEDGRWKWDEGENGGEGLDWGEDEDENESEDEF